MGVSAGLEHRTQGEGLWFVTRKDLEQGSPNFFLRGPDHFTLFFNVGPGWSVTENDMGRVTTRIIVEILNVLILLD